MSWSTFMFFYCDQKMQQECEPPEGYYCSPTGKGFVITVNVRRALLLVNICTIYLEIN